MVRMSVPEQENPGNSRVMVPQLGPPGIPTIAAIATGAVAAGVGIIRISGPQALKVLQGMAPDVPASPLPRHAYLTRFVDDQGFELDRGLALFFPGPRSFTGEDVVEFQLHGSPRLLRCVLDGVLSFGGTRSAEAGEFSRRAFLNGRIDLARAEAVAELVGAETEAAVRAAAAQLGGELTRRAEQLRAALVDVAADLQGILDFPDEAEGAEAGLAARLGAAADLGAALLSDCARGGILRRRAKVVLYGPVNAGKSTLFNRMVGAERALVDAEAGTTRDALEAVIEVGGLAVTLVDTAGLREEAGRVEALGIARTREALSGADVAVLAIPPGATPGEVACWRTEAAMDRRVEIACKADLQAPSLGLGSSVIPVSGASGSGIEELRAALLLRLGGGVAKAVLLVSDRQHNAVRHVSQGIENARSALTTSTLEVVAGEVELALAALGDITGEDASEAVLDAVFRRFCVGK